MSYGRKYFLSFDNLASVNYTVWILEKNYDGPRTALEGAANPFVLSYDTSEEFVLGSIRGSKATIQYIDNGGLPITTFASNEDDKFKVEFYRDTTLLWSGLLVQDDCREDWQPVPKTVTLTATDNLALLKDISLDTALAGELVEVDSITDIIGRSGAPANLFSWAAATEQIHPNDIIVISGTTFDGTYNVIGAIQGTGTNVINVQETVFSGASQSGTVTIYRPLSIAKITLAEYLNICLKQTGLEIPLDIYCNIFENGMDDRTVDVVNEPLSQAKLDTRTFIKSESEWDSCYDVLNKILNSWNASLFQSDGKWNFIRWTESRFFTNEIPGTSYEYDLQNPTSITSPTPLTIEKDGDIVPIRATHSKSLVRANKYAKLTYNYEQPFKLILNDDLKQLGTLINTQTIGSIRYDDYTFPHWLNTQNVPYYIRIEYDISVPNEPERSRYVVLEFLAPKNPALADYRVIYPILDIPVNQGDRFEFSLQFRGDSGTNISVRHNFSIVMTANDGSIYSLTNVSNKLRWNTIVAGNVGNGLQYSLANEDLTQWRSHDIFEDTTDTFSPRFPKDGVITIYLWGFNNSNGTDTPHAYLKDFRFTYFPYINDSTQVLGHIHKSVQNVSIKNRLERVIFVDDAPKNNLRGVMFLEDGTTKTSVWHRGDNSEALQFGYIQKTDLLTVTDDFRSKIEGDFEGLYDGSTDVSLLNIFSLTDVPNVYFIFGQVEFDYYENEFTGTLEELWKSGETEGSYLNTFEYIYRTK